MRKINIDRWINGYKVQIMDWIDGKNIYCNVAYYPPGARVNNPTWEKCVLIQANEKAYKALDDKLYTLVNAIASLKTYGTNVVLTIEN